MAAGEDVFRRAVGNGDGGRTRRPAHAFLQPATDHVHAPAVGRDLHPAQRRGGVNIGQHVILAAQRAHPVQRLGNGGGRITMDARQHMRAVGDDRVLDLLQRGNLAPRNVQRHDFGANALRDFGQQQPETARAHDQQLHPRFNQRDQRCLDSRARRAINQKGPAVVGHEHLTV